MSGTFLLVLHFLNHPSLQSASKSPIPKPGTRLPGDIIILNPDFHTISPPLQHSSSCTLLKAPTISCSYWWSYKWAWQCAHWCHAPLVERRRWRWRTDLWTLRGGVHQTQWVIFVGYNIFINSLPLSLHSMCLVQWSQSVLVTIRL